MFRVRGGARARVRQPALPLCVLAGILAVVAVAAAPAGAADSRPFKETFGNAAQPIFTKAEGMAVDQSSGDLLVIDATARTLSRWHEDGSPDDFSALGTNVIDGEGSGNCATVPADCDQTPQNSILGTFREADEVQVAVDESGGATDGDIYLTDCSHNLIDIFASSGEYLGQLTEYEEGPAADGPLHPLGETCGVAVDSGGAVYISDFSGKVHKFVSQGVPHNPLVNTDNTANFTTGPTLPNPVTLAAGAGPTAGFLFVTQYLGGGGVFKLDASSGVFKYEVSSGVSSTVSVDPVSGHVLVAKGSEAREYDASGAGSATEVIDPIEPGSAVEGVAATGASGDVYLTRAGEPNVEVYGPPGTTPVVLTKPATNVAGSGATLNGTVNPEGVELTECFFEYGKTTAYDETVPCAESPEDIGDDTAPVPVHADVGELDVATIYHYRLVAANAGVSASGLDESFQTLGPVLGEVWVGSTTATGAELKARINPEGKATTFHIEYGLTTTYGSNSAEQSAGSGNALQTFTAKLDGLTPGTTYHWRVVATSDAVNQSPDHTFTTYRLPVLDTGCENQGFRTGPSAHLPDCRAYEMVSPLDKNGGDIVTGEILAVGNAEYRQAALDGNRFAYTSSTAFGDAVRGAWANQYLSSRHPLGEPQEGWSTHGLNPPQGTTVFDPGFQNGIDIGSNFFAFTPDLCHALLEDQNLDPLTPEAIHGYTDLYLRDNCGPGADSYQAITTGGPPLSIYSDSKILSSGARNYSGDLSEIVFGGAVALAATPPPITPVVEQKAQIYDYHRPDGALRLVSVLPGGGASPDFNAVGTGDVSRGATLARAFTGDGSRIFWTASANEGIGRPGRVYVRLNPGQPESAAKDGSGNCIPEPAKACTLPIDESGTAIFWTASADGQKALVSSGNDESFNADLYEFDVATEAKSPIAGRVGGVAGASADLSRVYFTSKEALAPGAEEGEPNLYLHREGEAAGEATLVATLAPIDAERVLAGGGIENGQTYTRRGTRLSADGHVLAFTSIGSPTGYDNTVQGQPGCELNGELKQRCTEVYRYDSAANSGAGELICVSCNPGGARPEGGSLIAGLEWSNVESRALSTDGKRIFFESRDPLLPEDVNGARDVYQWEAPGEGRCDSAGADYFAQNGGCLDLISTGRSSADSEFVDASADGHDAFISTNSSIDPRDPGLIDIYDAREGGGFPVPTEPPECVGDACQSVPAAPNDPTPTSAAFRGPGDPATARCRKGKVRRKGRCVARKHRKRAQRQRRRANHERRTAR